MDAEEYRVNIMHRKDLSSLSLIEMIQEVGVLNRDLGRVDSIREIFYIEDGHDGEYSAIEDSANERLRYLYREIERRNY